MLKKMVILGVIGFVAVTALGGTKLASYIRSEIRAARQEAEDSIPPEKELARLEDELKQFDKDLLAKAREVATARKSVTKQQEELQALTDQHNADKARLDAFAQAIKTAEAGSTEVTQKGSETQKVSFENRTIKIAKAKDELKAAAARFKNNEKQLETMEQTLAQNIENRDTLEKQFDTMKGKKDKLAVDLKKLRAKINALKLQQMKGKSSADDSRLSKLEEDINKLETKLDVESDAQNLVNPVLPPPAAPPASTENVDDIWPPKAATKAPAKPEVKPSPEKKVKD